MISSKDSTILAMLSRYPNIPTEEADLYISKIEHEDNVPICHAVIGRIRREELSEDAKLVFDEFQTWSANRTLRTQQEQWNARRRNKENKLVLKMINLHRLGVIDDSILALYGISGNMPDVNYYRTLNADQKRAIWEQRMESRFGPNWRDLISSSNFIPISSDIIIKPSKVNWEKQGF